MASKKATARELVKRTATTHPDTSVDAALDLVDEAWTGPTYPDPSDVLDAIGRTDGEVALYLTSEDPFGVEMWLRVVDEQVVSRTRPDDREWWSRTEAQVGYGELWLHDRLQNGEGVSVALRRATDAPFEWEE